MNTIASDPVFAAATGAPAAMRVKSAITAALHEQHAPDRRNVYRSFDGKNFDSVDMPRFWHDNAMGCGPCGIGLSRDLQALRALRARSIPARRRVRQPAEFELRSRLECVCRIR